MADPTSTDDGTGPLHALKRFLGLEDAAGNQKEPSTIGGSNPANDQAKEAAGMSSSAKLGQMKQAQSSDRDNSYSY